MALESFYGGKQGVSPVIKARFKYVNIEDPAYQGRLNTETHLTKEEQIWLNDALNASYNEGDSITWTAEYLKPFTMDECLKDINYTDVWYGELCIIDTDNKMNPNNGKLYRRTLKQSDNKFVNTEDTRYAEYIGQIVGPSGGIPQFDFGSLDVERKKAVGELPTYNSELGPLDNSNWDYSYKDADSKNITSAIPHSYENIAISESGVPGVNTETANIQMVPGKSGNNYNDTIRYTWCNVRRKLDGNNEDAWIYLGFEIPYTFYDVSGKEENYTYNGKVFIDNSNNNHPFYKNYTFHIPRGTRGIGPERVYTINPKETSPQPTPNPLYAFDAIQYDQSTDTYSINTSKTKTVTATESYWVAMWSLYNPKTTNVETVYQYLGSYKDIRGVALANDGTLTFTYSDNTKTTFSKKIKWITSITIDTTPTSNTYGKMTINYNNGDAAFTKILPFIKTLTYNDSTGKFQTIYADGLTLNLKDGNGNDFVFTYPKTATLDTTTTSSTYGQFTITSNRNTTLLQETLPLIKSASYNASTGKITFNYSKIGNQTIGTISYISKMKVLDNGTIQYQLNTESGNTWHNVTDGASSPTPLKIKDIKTTEIRTDGHLWIQYRDNTWEDLGQVKGNAVAGIVYTLQSNNADGTFASVATALNDLQNKTYNDGASTSIGGNNDGRIKVDNTDVTGGMVSALIKENSSDDPYSAIFYYNPVTDTWMTAGTIGDTIDGSGGGNSNIYIQDSTTVYPEDNAINPKIYFTDGSNESSSSNISFYATDFSPWVNKSS